MRGFALALVALALLPPALAQPQPGVTANVRVSLADPGLAVPPNGTVPVLLSGVYTVGPGGRPAPDPQEEDTLANKTRVALAVDKMPDWASDARVEPPEVWLHVRLPGAGGTDVPFSAVVLVTAKPDAPALVRGNVTVSATASANGNIPAAAGTYSLPLKPALVAKVEIAPAVEGPFLMSGGRWATIPFRVQNLGNADAIVALNVTVRPERSEVEFPKELRLARGEGGTVEVRVRTPWTERETGTIELEGTPVVDTDDAPTATASIDVVGESAVPGAPPAWLVAGLAACALLLRKATPARARSTRSEHL